MTDLELLKDDSHYYGKVGKKYLSASNIKVLCETPELFLNEQDENVNFLLGRYFHTSILEPKKLKDFEICDMATRNNKVYKELGKLTLLRRESDELDKLKDVLLSKKELKDLIYAKGNEFEVPKITELFGVKFKGKADIINHEKKLVIDIKTTSDILKFKYSARKYYYNSQSYIYKALFGYDMIFIVADKKTGIIKMYTCSDEFYNEGKNNVITAIKNYLKFFDWTSEQKIDDYFEICEL